jgi:hypothetical protein
MLEIVEHQQEMSILEKQPQAVKEWLIRSIRHVQDLGNGDRHHVWLAYGVKRDEGNAIPECCGEIMGQLHRDPGFANAARTGQREERDTVAIDQGANPVEVG